MIYKICVLRNLNFYLTATHHMTLPMPTTHYADFASFSCRWKSLNLSILTIIKKKTIDLSTKNQSLYLPKTLVMHPHLLNLNSSAQTFYTFPYCFIHHRVFSLWLQQHISFTLTSSLTPLHQLTKMEALAITDKLKFQS